MIKLYGIPNCNSVSKARKWLSAHNIDYQFHNFKKEGLDKETLDQWLDELGWEVLLNKRGTTWRKLDDDTKKDIDRDKASEIMLYNTSIIKRPVIDLDGKFYCGFKEELYQTLLLA